MKKYFEPEFEVIRFSFEKIMENFAADSDPESDILVYDGDNPNYPNDPDPGFP